MKNPSEPSDARPQGRDARPADRNPPSPPVPVSPHVEEPPGQSPLPLLMYWFVIPLAVVLALEFFGVFERIAAWFGSG